MVLYKWFPLCNRQQRKKNKSQNARIAKFLTLQKQAKTVGRQTTEKITYVLGGKMTNASTKENKNLWDFGSKVSCPLTRAITMEVSKGKYWRHARLNVTWHRLCSGSNQEITSSASLVARAAYETNFRIYMFMLCKRISLEGVNWYVQIAYSVYKQFCRDSGIK